MNVVYYFFQVLATPTSMVQLWRSYSNSTEASMVDNDAVISLLSSHFNGIDNVGAGFSSKDSRKNQENGFVFLSFLLRVYPV